MALDTNQHPHSGRGQCGGHNQRRFLGEVLGLETLRSASEPDTQVPGRANHRDLSRIHKLVLCWLPATVLGNGAHEMTLKHGDAGVFPSVGGIDYVTHWSEHPPPSAVFVRIHNPWNSCTLIG